MNYRKVKTYIQTVILILYYISALPESTMLFADQGQFYTPFNRIRTLTVYAMTVCAAVSVIHRFAAERDPEKGLFEQILMFPFRHLAMTIPAAAFFICIFASKNTYQFKLLLFLIAMSDTDLDQHYKGLFVVNVLFMVWIMLWTKQGLIRDVTAYRNDGTIRHSLGYIFPLDCHGHLLSIALIYMYLRKEKFNWYDVIAVNVPNCLLYTRTDARTDMIVIVLASAALFIINKIGQEKFSGYIWSVLESFGTLVMAACPFVLTWMYDPEIPWMRRLNSILSDRLALQKKVVAEEGFSLFGKPIEWTGWGGYDGTDKPDYNYVDCSFMRDTFDRGISFEVIFLTGCTFLYFFLNRKKDVTGAVLMFFFLLSALVEDHIILIQFYPIMFLFSGIVMLENRELTGLLKREKKAI